MALIYCNECGSQISSDAKSCPNCGYENNYNKKKETKKSNTIWKILKNILYFLVVAILLWKLYNGMMILLDLNL